MYFRQLHEHDRDTLTGILRRTPSFIEVDVQIAIELIDDRIAKGDGINHSVILPCEGDEVMGYACYGRIPLTDNSFDLYWIVVAPERHGQGVGVQLMNRVDNEAKLLGGMRIYADTSSGKEYARARRFYQAAGFHEAARLPDFYRQGEDKLIYCRELGVDRAR